MHGGRVELEARRYEWMRVWRVVGPVEAGKRYTALRKTGGREECGTIFAPINEFAPEGSINLEGKVMWASEPKVRMAHPPTEAWNVVRGALPDLRVEKRVVSWLMRRMSVFRWREPCSRACSSVREEPLWSMRNRTSMWFLATKSQRSWWRLMSELLKEPLQLKVATRMLKCDRVRGFRRFGPRRILGGLVGGMVVVGVPSMRGRWMKKSRISLGKEARGESRFMVEPL